MSLIPLALLQFLVPVLPQLGLGQSIGARALREGATPELPPGIFFAIWGVIFTAYLVFALRANLRPGYLSNALAGPLSLAGLGNIIWMLAAQQIGSETLNAILLVPLLSIVWFAAWLLDRSGGFDGTASRILPCLLIGLFSGWITVAVGISLPPVLRSALDLGPTDHVWLTLWTVLLPAIALARLFASRISRSLWYYVALSWGLTGIIVNTWCRMELHALAIATTGILGLILLSRWRYPAPGAGPRVV